LNLILWELARDAKAAMRASKNLPEARKKARTLNGQTGCNANVRLNRGEVSWGGQD